jgi:hypothetical protein
MVVSSLRGRDRERDGWNMGALKIKFRKLIEKELSLGREYLSKCLK